MKRMIKKFYHALIDGWQKIRRSVKKAFAVLSCLSTPLKKSAFQEDAPQKFDHIYPDKGSLAKQTGFLHQDTIFDLTIIIPIYNAEKYIESCLSSILSQKTKYSFEVLVIDDGSTDNSAALVQKFADHKNIQLFRQENRGQAAARNRAIYLSQGKYIMMVDVDDLLLDGAIEELMDLAVKTGSDISEGAVTFFRENSPCDPKQPLEQQIVIRSEKKDPGFVLRCYGYSWAKVYKRALWAQTRYPEGYIFEDIISKFVLRRKANQVAFTNRFVYGYLWNPNSSSHSKNNLKKLDSLRVFPRILAICEQNHLERDRVFYLLSLNHICLLNYITTNALDDEIRKTCFEVLRLQLRDLKGERSYRLPAVFQKLEKAVLCGDYAAWSKIAGIIYQYCLLRKYREIN